MAYSDIKDPSEHFQTVLYTGNGGTLSVTNDGNSDLQPDWVWIKNRTAYQHQVYDTNRGVHKKIMTSVSNAETTDTTALTAFNTDGFSTGANVGVNQNNVAHVAWQWKANGGTTTSFSESGNNPGGTRQTNVDAGFSIITYTGTGANASCQLAHGLGKAPEWIIFKRREAAQVWAVWHKELGDDYKLVLNSLDGKDADGAFMNSTLPDATNIYVGGTSVNTNADGGTYNCYAWTSIKGYSKFGRYTGSGNANGPFIYTGFRPAYVLIKPDGANNHWVAMDTTRDEYNGGGTAYIFPNANEGQQTAYERMDFLSNGFKLRTNGGEWNGSGRNILYMAFAEHPFVTSTGAPVTAR